MGKCVKQLKILYKMQYQKYAKVTYTRNTSHQQGVLLEILGRGIIYAGNQGMNVEKLPAHWKFMNSFWRLKQTDNVEVNHDIRKPEIF